MIIDVKTLMLILKVLYSKIKKSIIKFVHLIILSKFNSIKLVI